MITFIWAFKDLRTSETKLAFVIMILLPQSSAPVSGVVAVILPVSVSFLNSMRLGSLKHLRDLLSKSPFTEIHIKATNVKGDSSIAAVVIHWLLQSDATASVDLREYFHMAHSISQEGIYCEMNQIRFI